MSVSEYKGRKRVIRFGQVGSADILGVLSNGRALAVECKVGNNKLSEAQEDWLRRFSEAGGMAIVAYSLDDLEQHVLRF